MTAALLCLNLINDFVHPDGKLADQGIADFAKAHNSLATIKRIQDHFREQGGLVMHVRTGFSKNWPEHPAGSPILGPMRELGALQLGQWGTEFAEEVTPLEDEPVLTKHRIGPFYRSRLEIIMSTQKVSSVYLVGCTTMSTVMMTAYEAHDRDFKVTVLRDGCMDKTEDRHNMGLACVEECAEVVDFKDIALRLAMNAGNTAKYE